MLPKLNLPIHQQRLNTEKDKQRIFCQVRKKFLVLTPEEWVRQCLVSFLNLDLGYPLSLMKIEREVKGGNRNKRADLIMYNNKAEPVMLIECKSASEKLGKETFFQLGRYNRTVNAPYLLITNGMKHYCCQFTKDEEFNFLSEIPRYDELSASV